MARKTANSGDETSDLELEPDATPAERDEELFEKQVLTEFGEADNDTQWLINVDKMPVDARGITGPKGDRIYSMDASEFHTIYQRCRDDYGTGIYRIFVYKNGTLWKRNDLRIRVPDKPKEVPVQASEMATVLSEIRASNERTLQLFEKFFERASQPAPAVQHNSFDDLSKLVSVMLGLQGIMQPKQAVESSATMFMEGVKFAKELVPEERPEGMAGILRDLLQSPLLEKIAGAQQVPQPLQLPPGLPPAYTGATARQAPPQAPRQNESGTVNRVNPQSQNVPSYAKASEGAPAPSPVQPVRSIFEEHESPFATTSGDMESGQLPPVTVPASAANEFATVLNANPQLRDQLHQAVSYLISRAEKGSDPEYYADWIDDNWPPEFVDALLEVPNLQGLMETVAPDAAKFRPWFSELISTLQTNEEGSMDGSGLAGESAEDAVSGDQPAIDSSRDSGRPGGRKANAGTHERTGKER